MRIAVISDIHSNLAALEAVIADLEQHGPDMVIVAGDMINRGPCPAEVLDRLLDTGWLMVMGNHERYILDHLPGAEPLPAQKQIFAGLSQWTYDRLSREQVALLPGLPHAARIAAPDGSLALIVHATPRALNENITIETPAALIYEMLGTERPALLCCAHTHQPFVRRVDGMELINIGAVGAPFDGDPRARYGMLSWRDGCWQAALQAVEYDRTRTLAAFGSSGMLREVGPMAVLTALEIRTARPHLGPCIRAHRDALIAGSVSLQQALEQYLERIGVAVGDGTGHP